MSPAVMSIDGAKIKETLNANETSRSIQKFLAERLRNTAVTDLPRTKMEILRSGGTIQEADYVETWKKLDALGVGTYFKGRGINKDTFTWKYSLRIIAQAALTGNVVDLSEHLVKAKPTVKVAKKETGPKFVPAKDLSAKKKTLNPTKAVHVYLRPDFMVELVVPADFSKAEAQQICQSVSRLAN